MIEMDFDGSDEHWDAPLFVEVSMSAQMQEQGRTGIELMIDAFSDAALNTSEVEIIVPHMEVVNNAPKTELLATEDTPAQDSAKFFTLTELEAKLEDSS